MADKIFLHVGFPKTGTTALQASLADSSTELLALGFDYSPPWNNAHHRAAWSLVDYVFGWNSKGGSKTPKSVWNKFVKDINKRDGNVLISSEFFIRANIELINKIKNELSAKEYVIVFTLRPFAKILPSRYQQTLKRGMTWTYEQWLEKVFGAELDLEMTDFAEPNPELIDYVTIIKNWADVFGKENIKLVLTDETNPDNLYRRFEQALGLPSNLLKIAKAKKLNRSLTASEASILRAVNAQKPKKWKWNQYRYFIRGNFVKYLSDSPSKFPQDPKLQLPNSVLSRIESYSLDQIKRLDNLGISIYGDTSLLHEANSGNESEKNFDQVPVEMVADLVIHLSSVTRFAGTSTKGLVREIGSRLVRSPRFIVRVVGKITLRVFK